MICYDKAAWHIDGGENTSAVVTRFKEIFRFLADNKMLNDDGVETLEYGMDSSVSLNSTMLNDEGKEFLDNYYDVIIKQNPKEVKMSLESAYQKFKEGVHETGKTQECY